MAFDAKQAVIDQIAHLEDELKQRKEQLDAVVADLEKTIAAKQDELDGWQSLLGRDKPGPSSEKPPAKKAAAKK